MSMADLLEIQNLTASYGSKEVLHDISVTVTPGEFTCLCGPNGSGKSTLLSILAGVPAATLRFSAGAQSPADLTKLPRRAAARFVAFMQQNEFSEWNFKVRDFVLQGRFAHSKGGHYTASDYKLVDDVLAELNLSHFANRNIHDLSGGEFQKIRLARALAQTPRFLLLDEPAASLDYVFEPQLMKLLKNTAHQKKIGILASIHDINLAARFADKIILLPPADTAQSSMAPASSKKSVLYGSPSDIMNIDNLKYTFGVDFECKEIKSFQSLQ